jgi:sortase B|nr:class B sortase [uncultured Blautia sp.]
MKKLRTFAVSMIVAALGLLIYCGGFFIRSYKQNLAAKQGYEEIADIAVTAEKENKKDLNRKTKDVQDMSDTQDKDASEKKKRKKNRKYSNEADKIRESFGISWENLRKINSQVAAWITIPGADISYPVVQGTDDEYYLNHNFRKAEDLFGCIFLEHNNKKDLTGSHSIIYGHNMEGNMMFANLNRYEQPEFLKSCPEIEILTPERKFLYKIFSVEQASSQSAAFEYGYELSSPAYKLQLTELKNNSMYDTGIEPEESAPVVTLVTCNSHLDKEIRMAVHGSCYEIINSV